MRPDLKLPHITLIGKELNWLIKSINELMECMQADTSTQAKEICENLTLVCTHFPF